MKILAIIGLAPGANIDAVRRELDGEIRGSWALYASGLLRETYATESPTRVVFVFEAVGTAEVERELRKLPLVAKGLMTFELVELRPFVNWSRLFAQS
jgi:hypothetical protein